jgi:hypothetical protein
MKTLKTLSEDLKKRASKAQNSPVAPPKAPAGTSRPSRPSCLPYSLPAWPEAVRGVPNCVLRSGIFGAIRRGKREYIQAIPIGAPAGIGILFSGPQLDQADLDVWQQCLHIARHQDAGSLIYFGARDFLRSIGRSEGGRNLEWLRNVFRRLASSVVEIDDGRRSYFGPMLQQGARDDQTGEYVIKMNSAIVALFIDDGWTQIEWEQRLALAGQPLAQWLHGFYATHARPFGIQVATLRNLCGSENGQLFGFRRELKEALAKVAQVTGWTLGIDENDLVQVRKRPTPSQGRHLLRNGK